MCGEQLTISASVVAKLGSPPRVRGTARLLSGAKRVWGITPACAGNSMQNEVYRCAFWDHPRVCGEQALDQLFRMVVVGSPPRVRGTAAGRPVFHP